MRSVKYTLALASLGALVTFASCTLITDVDRSKIPAADASPGDAGEGNSGGSTSGSGGAGNRAGGAGKPGDSGGTGGDGEGGAGGDSAGAAGEVSSAGHAGSSGSAGSSGNAGSSGSAGRAGNAGSSGSAGHAGSSGSAGGGGRAGGGGLGGGGLGGGASAVVASAVVASAVVASAVVDWAAVASAAAASAAAELAATAAEPAAAVAPAATPAALAASEPSSAVPLQAPPEGFQSRVERALLGFDLPDVSEQLKAKLCAYCELAVSWNQRVDLTAARSADELVDLLLADALAICGARPGAAGERWFDVGSGIGAPGIPLALLSPVQMTLIEPRTKRVAFLRTAAGSLGRPDIAVSRSRSDEFRAASCDVAVSRATLPPPEWLAEGARLATRSVWLLLAKAGVPDLGGRGILADIVYSWPLTGAQRRAVCVGAQFT